MLDGGAFTWNGGQDSPVLSYLGYFLISTDRKEHFYKVAQKILPRPASDNYPILLDSRGLRVGKCSFGFEKNVALRRWVQELSCWMLEELCA